MADPAPVPRNREAARIVRRYGLHPHPEGGWYREIHRSPLPASPATGGKSPRCALKVILFLLTRTTFSAFHRLESEETWTHLAGAPLELVLLGEVPEFLRLDAAGGDGEPVVAVPAGAVQAARTLGAYTFAACHVAPGFDFADFELPGRDALLRSHPGQAELIRRFTRGRQGRPASSARRPATPRSNASSR